MDKEGESMGNGEKRGIGEIKRDDPLTVEAEATERRRKTESSVQGEVAY